MVSCPPRAAASRPIGKSPHTSSSNVQEFPHNPRQGYQFLEPLVSSIFPPRADKIPTRPCRNFSTIKHRPTWCLSFHRWKERCDNMEKWWSLISSFVSTSTLPPVYTAAYSQYQSSLFLGAQDWINPASFHLSVKQRRRFGQRCTSNKGRGLRYKNILGVLFDGMSYHRVKKKGKHWNTPTGDRGNPPNYYHRRAEICRSGIVS